MNKAMSRRSGHGQRSHMQRQGCQHRNMRAITPDEDPNHETRRQQPFTCDDCSSVAIGQSRFTQGYVVNMLLAERRRPAVPA